MEVIQLQQYNTFNCKGRSKKGVSAVIGTLLITLVTTTGGVGAYVFSDNAQKELTNQSQNTLNPILKLSENEMINKGEGTAGDQLQMSEDNTNTKNLLICHRVADDNELRCSMRQVTMEPTDDFTIDEIMDGGSK